MSKRNFFSTGSDAEISDFELTDEDDDSSICDSDSEIINTNVDNKKNDNTVDAANTAVEPANKLQSSSASKGNFLKSVVQKKNKAKKRCNHFNDKWLNEFDWLQRVDKSQSSLAYCKICRKQFSVENKGYTSLTQHSASKNHKLAINVSNYSAVSQFFVKKNTSEENHAIAVEVAHTFHAVKHNLSYNSLDCEIKLLKKTFNDSSVSSKLSCGRTKSTLLVCKVMAPHQLSEDIKYIKENNVLFSIQVDASNHKNRKMFPICIQYYTMNERVTNKIIDFVENSDETAAGMSSMVQESLNKLSLNLKNVISLSADNTNSNFGKNNSLYTNLKHQNNEILKANCHAHILHNCVKYAMNELDVDVENLILKSYAHFSHSAKRRDELVKFHEFASSEFRELLRHVSTRWVSLLPAVDRLLVSWEALKSYFLSQPDLPKQLIKVLKINDDGVPEKIEIYLLFSSHVLQLFNNTIKKLESNNTSAVDLFLILESLKIQLEERKNKKFFGFEVNLRLSRLLPTEKIIIEKDFIEFFNLSLKYLSDRFDFTENNWLFAVSKVSLINGQQLFQLDDLVAICDKLNLKEKLQNLDLEMVFDEYTLLQRTVEISQEHLDEVGSSAEKYKIIFGAIGKKIPNIFKIISFVLSIPATSAFTERVFSVMEAKWKDERNRCTTNLIKHELILYFNSKKNCVEYFESIKNDKKFLTVARSNQKYL